METLLPFFERERMQLRVDPHLDAFVDDGLEALRIIRGLNSPDVADMFDHHGSHGLRSVANPSGNAVRVHQHLTIGDGDVDWTGFFAGLATNGFFERDDSILVSNVFAADEDEDEDAEAVSRFQLETIRNYIAAATLN